MKTTLLILTSALLALSLPATAEAHYDGCRLGDAPCLAKCTLMHRHTPPPHDCWIEVPDLVEGPPVP